MAIIANLTVDQGSSYVNTIDLQDSNGLPLNVTGQLFRAQFRKSYQSTNLTDFICTVTSASGGNISIALTADVTRNIKAGRYVYDVEMYNTGSSTCTRLREGQIEFTAAATNPIGGVPNYPYRASGHGTPETFVTGLPGYSYVDVDSNTLYFKMTGNSTTGWQAFVQL